MQESFLNEEIDTKIATRQQDTVETPQTLSEQLKDSERNSKFHPTQPDLEPANPSAAQMVIQEGSAQIMSTFSQIGQINITTKHSGQ